jgi:DNA-binding transcriptional ArsR family regulator
MFRHLSNFGIMERKLVLAVFESLASGVRLDVFRLLVQAEPQGMIAGDIATALDVPSSTLSFHLRTLSQAGLAMAEQEGRFVRYRANLALMTEVIGYLTENCCAGHPKACSDLAACAPDCPSPLDSQS